MDISVHDIITIKSVHDIQFDDEKPDWIDDALAENPYAIVRRAPIVNSRIPIGIRGAQRQERASAHIGAADITDCITPEDVAGNIHLFNRKPILTESLAQIKRLMDEFSVLWGLIGSIAYEIVSQAVVVKDSSDIDIIIRSPLDRQTRKRIVQHIESLPVRVDILMEMEEGAYSLIEFVESKDQKIMMRTIEGPKLVEKAKVRGGE